MPTEINDSVHPFDSPSKPITPTDAEGELAAIRACRVGLEAYLAEGKLDNETWLRALVELRSFKSELSDLIEDVVQYLAPKLPYDPFVVEGLGMVNKRRRTDRKSWDKEALLSAVLDSRLVDEDGVVADESPLDRVLACFNLPAPRLTALRDRKIEPDQFCAVEQRGYDIEVTS